MTLSEIWLLWGSLHHLGHTDRVERFAALVAAAEREACAKVCDKEAERLGWPTDRFAADNCAAAIRARSINDKA